MIVSHATIDAPKSWPFSCDDVNLKLAAIRRQDIANGGDGRTHYFGMVSDANGASFMRGCAADIPDHSAPDTVASGPAGSAVLGGISMVPMRTVCERPGFSISRRFTDRSGG